MQTGQRRLTAIQALRPALCLLTLLSLSTALQADAQAAAPIVPVDAAIWALGLWGLWKLYGAWLSLTQPIAGKRWWALSALFAAVVTLGQSFAAIGAAELALTRWPAALLLFGGRVPLYFAAMRLLSNALAARGKPVALPNQTLIFAAALLVCWLPYYLCTFPGVVSNDSITQLKEIFGIIPMSNGNPVFQTFLIQLCLTVGNWLSSPDAAVALYCGAQGLLMAWLLGALLCEMARSEAAKPLLWGCFAFYALCPVFPLFAFCMGKDTNFAMATLFLALTAWRIVRAPREGGASPALTACLCLSAVLCALLRNPGVYLALMTLALLLVWTLRKARRSDGLWRAPTYAALAVLCAYGVVNLWIIPSLDIRPMPETEEYSLPLQQVARVAASAELTPEEAAAIDGVLELSKLKAAYNGELSDPVKLLWREDVTDVQKQAFWRTWLSLLAKHPATCLSATFHNTYGYLYPGYMSALKPTLLIGDQSTRTASVKELFNYNVNPRSGALKAFTDGLAKNPLYRLLVSPGLYGWITLFAAAALASRGRRRALAAAAPALFTLAGLLFSAVNGYFRYAMPLYLCAPLLLWLCAYQPTKGESF